ncbi:MAG: hypothetical protein QXH03_02875 [Candidatus Bathyarchaeia archaeon]
MKENTQYKYCLHLDWDYPWPKHWVKAWKEWKTKMLEDMGFKVQEIIMKPSPSRKGGTHIWIHITSPHELSDDEINMLQWLCLDQDTRVWINIMRIERNLRRWWNKLFTRHIWKKPLPENCQKCSLLRILKEMREQWLQKRGT